MKRPDQVAKLLQTYLDKGNAPKQSWMEFVYPVNNNGKPRWIINKEALADRMWNATRLKTA
jgi:hypothetical protein